MSVPESESCQALSLAIHEDQSGTASNATHWVGVEYHGPWRAKAVLDNDLPARSLSFLQALQSRPDTRPLLIKRRGARGNAVYYVHLPSRRVHRFDLTDPGQLPDLPWADLWEGATDEGLCAERPIWVCTHSNRDACCGRHGPAVARALEAAAPGRVWQCTHLGGHRFAATLVALPEGVMFGRVTEEEAADLVAGLDQGRWYNLDKARGALTLPPPAQAAEIAVRRRLGATGFGAVVVRGWTPGDAGTEVALTADGSDWVARVARIRRPEMAPPSCGEALSAVPAWSIVVEPSSAV